jgi:plasmid stabilization system protein ParE
LEKNVKPVYWANRSVKDLERITRFNFQLLGVEKAISIAIELQQLTKISENPTYDFSKIGSVNDEFKHLKRNYRKLLLGNYKITYREGKTKIYINRVFDTRQHPNKNK